MFNKKQKLEDRRIKALNSCSELLEDLRIAIVKYLDAVGTLDELTIEASRIWDVADTIRDELRSGFDPEYYPFHPEDTKLWRVRKIAGVVDDCCVYVGSLNGLHEILKGALKDIDALSTETPKPSKTIRGESL